MGRGLPSFAILTCLSAVQAAAAAAAAPSSTTAAVPPLIAALTALRNPLTLPPSGFVAPGNSTSRSTSVLAVSTGSSSSSPPAAAAGVPLDALRPAAAAALSRQSGAAPLSDDDIVAINLLLGREGPASSPYCYDTGLLPEKVQQLVSFGNYTPTTRAGASSARSRRNSSMQSRERLQRLSSLGPLSWLARSYVVTGEELLKLRITQMLQLILEDAICDSLASAANLPPNQVVTFADANLTLSLGFRGVDWDDGIPKTAAAAGAGSAAAAAADLPHKGLVAIKQAMQELTGNYDPDHVTVSMEALPRPRGPPRSTTALDKKQQAAGAGAGTGAAAAAEAIPALPPSAANTAHRKLLQQQQQQKPQGLGGHSSNSSSSNSSGFYRQLQAADRVPELQVVYVRLYGMDPMNLTSLFEKLGSCAAGPLLPGHLPAGPLPLGPTMPDGPIDFGGLRPGAGLLESGGPQTGPDSTLPLGPTPAAAPGRMPELPTGRAFSPSCAETFRRHLHVQGVPVSSGPGFSVAPWEEPRAAIGLSVAVGLTRGQQITTDTDVKASTWLNSTSLQAILGTFNLTVASANADFVSFMRDKESGSFPAIPGINLSLFEAVMAAGSNLTQQGGQQQQQQGLVPGASAALNKGILAGIIVAVVASVLALLGVAVLLLRRRGDGRGGSDKQPGGEEDAAANRRRRRRPRMYHAKYLPDAGPVLGLNALAADGSPTQPAGAAAAAAAAGAAAGSSPGSVALPRSTLERGDSVMSHVDLELEDAENEGDQSSEAGGSTTSLVHHAAVPQQHQHQQQQGLQPQQGPQGMHHGQSPRQGLVPQPKQPKLQLHPLERLQGATGSSGSSSKQQLLAGLHPSGSPVACSEVMAPAESSNWDEQGSVSTRALSMGLTVNSSQLSPWTSSSDAWQGCASPAGAVLPDGAVPQPASGTAGGPAGTKLHRLASASQAVSAPAAAGAAAEASAGGSSSSSSVTSRQQVSQVQQPAAGSPDSKASKQEQPWQGQQQLKGAAGRQGVAAARPAAAAGGSSFSMASAFAAMDAQLAAAARVDGSSSVGGASSDGGSSSASAKAVQPLGRSCWHKEGHESGFLVPGGSAAHGAGASAGPAQQGVRRSGGGMVSPFAAAVQLAYSVASDEIA